MRIFLSNRILFHLSVLELSQRVCSAAPRAAPASQDTGTPTMAITPPWPPPSPRDFGKCVPVHGRGRHWTSFKVPPNPTQPHSVLTPSCDHFRAKVSLPPGCWRFAGGPVPGRAVQTLLHPEGRMLSPHIPARTGTRKLEPGTASLEGFLYENLTQQDLRRLQEKPPRLTPSRASPEQLSQAAIRHWLHRGTFGDLQHQLHTWR